MKHNNLSLYFRVAVQEETKTGLRGSLWLISASRVWTPRDPGGSSLGSSHQDLNLRQLNWRGAAVSCREEGSGGHWRKAAAGARALVHTLDVRLTCYMTSDKSLDGLVSTGITFQLNLATHGLLYWEFASF